MTLKKLGLAIVALTSAAGAAAVGLGAGQRPIVNSRPDAHLRTLFPDAAAFSAKEGEPPVFKVYAADPKANASAAPVGYAFWTPELLPDERGYEGPIHILVGMDLAGALTGIVVDTHTEPYGYFSVEPSSFAAQFKGKSIHDPFRVGEDIAAVSRASLSIASAARAVRDSALLVEKAYLEPGSRR